jgi:hypothetical protein
MTRKLLARLPAAGGVASLLVGGLLAILAVRSAFRADNLVYFGPGGAQAFNAAAGWIEYRRIPRPENDGERGWWYVEGHILWGIRYGNPPPPPSPWYHRVRLPLGLLAPAAFSPAAVWLFRRVGARARRNRRAAAGLCPACGYDLRAGHDRCPECGAPPGGTTTTRLPAARTRPERPA